MTTIKKTKKYILTAIAALLFAICLLIQANAEEVNAVSVSADGEVAYFIGIDEAIDYINKLDESVECTITMLADNAQVSMGWIKKSVTIDLAGKTLSDVTIGTSSAVTVRITDSSEGKTGKLLKKDGIVGISAYDNGKFIIDGIATNVSFAVNYGEESMLEIIDMTVIDTYTSIFIYTGTANIKGGDFAELSVYFSDDEESNASLKVSGGSYTGFTVQNGTVADILDESVLITDENGNFLNTSTDKINVKITAAVHTHDYNKYLSDEEYHWLVCACGADNGEKLAHSWQDATCTEPITCKDCALTKGDALGHTYDNECADTECNVCGTVRTELSAHTFGDWTETKAPTRKENGEKTRTCTSCGFLETACVDALGGLGGGAIAAIIVACIVAVGAIVFCVYFFVIKKRKK